MEIRGERALGLAVINQATKEMRDTRPSLSRQSNKDKKRLRIEATVWLASAQATTWFEGCDLDQAYALGRIRWARHARELLEDESISLDPQTTRVLELGLDAAEPTE